MKLRFFLPLTTVAALALAGCAAGPGTQQGASKESMPMMAMSDKDMMEMCARHMSQMSPEMRQKHMEMMREMMQQR
ncbi:MAG: hypothetical protein JWQ21_2937 [Herminiimonas sp.]|nr:hypothetical protein [Herminiimonas sp.]